MASVVMAEIMQIGGFFKVVNMYGEETLKYISCLLKKGTKVCSFTFYIFYAQKCINCRNLLIYVHI
jgi:hypothetical protein